ncbi:MAG: alpha/beta fold hydrolase [Chloroflexota bacterium]
MPSQALGTGIDLYYESHGEGEPLVLIPSTGYAGNVFDMHLAPELSKSLRLITFDPRGCGRSSQPDSVYTIDQMACDVYELLGHLKIETAHVLGHSIGGRVALSLALNFPGRVKSLILAASGSGTAAWAGDGCVPGVPARWVEPLGRMGFEAYVRYDVCETETYFTDEFRGQHPDQVQAMYDVAWSQHAKWPAYIRICMARHTWDCTHRLSEIKQPALVVIGDHDTGGGNHMHQAHILADRIPNAELKLLPGQSHGFFWQAPRETNAWILDWVRGHS